MKILKVYTNKKEANVTAIATGIVKGKVTLMMEDDSTKSVSESTLKRWWTETGTITEAEVLTRLTGKKVTEKDLDAAAKKNEKAKTDKPAPSPKATSKPKKTDAEKEADKKAKADKKAVADKAKAAKKAEKEKAKAEKAAQPKPFKIRGNVADIIKKLVEDNADIEVADGYGHDLLVVKGIRKALFTGGAICMKVKDAEAIEIAHEVKGYNHPFKARVTIEATDLVTLEAALLTVINKL